MSRKCDLVGIGVRSGNKISHSNRKTRRRFLPNLRAVALHSDALGVDLNLRIAAATLRTVNKYGNIDNFLVNYRFAKLTEKARTLRNKVKRKLEKTGKLAEVQIVKAKKEKAVKAAAPKKKAVKKSA